MTAQSEETSETVGCEAPDAYRLECAACGVGAGFPQGLPVDAAVRQLEHAEACQHAAPPAPYADAVEEYLAAASWLGPADAPLKVHARAIAKSLDKQLGEKGEVQSALASSFDKVLYRLDARRPPARPPAPGLRDDDGDGTPSMFGFLSE